MTGRTSRLFVAVRPPPDVCSQLEMLPRPELPGVRWNPAHQWHVTLGFLGRAEEAAVASALASVSLPRCEAVMGPSVAMLGRSVVVVPVGGLEALAGVVRAATEGLGEVLTGRPFRGHVTLARLKAPRSGAGRDGRGGSTGDPDVPGAGVGRGLPLGMAVSGRWEPAAVELVSSVTDPRGALHETVASFRVD